MKGAGLDHYLLIGQLQEIFGESGAGSLGRSFYGSGKGLSGEKLIGQIGANAALLRLKHDDEQAGRARNLQAVRCDRGFRLRNRTHREGGADANEYQQRETISWESWSHQLLSLIRFQPAVYDKRSGYI